ncbi:hypothetical protein V8C86DRAFT_2878237 [Haematococcus lacustris]
MCSPRGLTAFMPTASEGDVQALSRAMERARSPSRIETALIMPTAEQVKSAAAAAVHHDLTTKRSGLTFSAMENSPMGADLPDEPLPLPPPPDYVTATTASCSLQPLSITKSTGGYAPAALTPAQQSELDSAMAAQTLALHENMAAEAAASGKGTVAGVASHTIALDAGDVMTRVGERVGGAAAEVVLAAQSTAHAAQSAASTVAHTAQDSAKKAVQSLQSLVRPSGIDTSPTPSSHTLHTTTAAGDAAEGVAGVLQVSSSNPSRISAYAGHNGMAPQLASDAKVKELEDGGLGVPGPPIKDDLAGARQQDSSEVVQQQGLAGVVQLVQDRLEDAAEAVAISVHHASQAAATGVQILAGLAGQAKGMAPALHGPPALSPHPAPASGSPPPS